MLDTEPLNVEPWNPVTDTASASGGKPKVLEIDLLNSLSEENIYGRTRHVNTGSHSL